MRYLKLPKNHIEPEVTLAKKNIFQKIFGGNKFLVAFVVILTIFLAIFLKFGLRPTKVFEYAYKVGNPFAGYNFKTTDDRVNILLLGNAGGKHDGAYLTDSIMVASYDLKNKKTVFVSLPRDLWLEEHNAKVNTLYEIGMKKKQGLEYSREAIGEILGLPIHYAVRIDFSGFEMAVDEVGGVDVDVERSFDDYLYPIAGEEDNMCGYKEEEREFSEEEAKSLNIDPGKRKVLIAPDGKVATDSADPNFGYEHFTCRYEHLSYKKGQTHMDGETALKYVRSRMGSNGEGNDFARSKRQQKVIQAFRAKVLSLETLANPKKIAGLKSAFDKTLEMDIPLDDLISLYTEVKDIDRSESVVLSNGGEDPLLINPPLKDYGGAWVLVPRDKTFGEIKDYIAGVLKGEEENEASPSARPR